MQKGSTTPAIKRAIIETELMEDFHWLPQDIHNIPYRDLQEYYIIRRQKKEAFVQRQALESENKSGQINTDSSSSRGQSKRMTKVTKLTP